MFRYDTFLRDEEGVALAKTATLTIPSATVGSDLTDFPLYIDLSEMPFNFWATTNHGTDLRASVSGSPIPCDVVWADRYSQEGAAFVKVPTIYSGSDTVIDLSWDGISLRPPRDNALGMAGVWSDYDAVILPSVDIFNRTGKSKSYSFAYTYTFNVVWQSPTVTGHEGVIPLPNGNFVVIGPNALRLYNAAADTVLVTNSDPAGDTGTAATDCGGGCYYDGKLYVTVGPPQQIAVFDPSDLSFIETFDISANADGAGGLEVCPYDGYIYTVPYVTGGGTTDLVRFDRTTGAYIDTITMSDAIVECQGIIWHDDAFFVANDDISRYIRVEMDGEVYMSGQFGFTGTIEDGGTVNGLLYAFRVTGSGVGIIEAWERNTNALDPSGAFFNANARYGVPITSPGTTWTLGTTMARADGTTRASVGLATASAFVGNVAYVSGTIRPFFDASNSSLAYGSAKNPSVGVPARVNVVYEGTTERRAFYNGGDKVTDAGITAIGSTFEFMVLGSDRNDTQSASWRGTVGFTYLRMEALSDDWIAAEYAMFNDPAAFYTII